MAKEILDKAKPQIPEWIAAEKAGKLKKIFYAPSSPLGFSGNSDLNIKSDLVLAYALGGGRLFGIGLRPAKKEQLVRVDYWDFRLPPKRKTPTPLFIHYHILEEKRHRPIWP
jgi:hypothetical protein